MIGSQRYRDCIRIAVTRYLPIGLAISLPINEVHAVHVMPVSHRSLKLVLHCNEFELYRPSLISGYDPRLWQLFHISQKCVQLQAQVLSNGMWIH